jgi:photosystem II stability/assembly factor-like uncharacterized protein
MLAASLLFAAALDTGNLSFRPTSPMVGRIGDVAGTDADPFLYYAGAAGGGVWKTTNGGVDWRPVFDAQDVAPIGAVAIDPSDANDVWVGTGEANPRNDVSYGDGVYRTVDGGKTWTHLGLEGTSHISRILIDPRDPNTVLVAALGDPFHDSEDRGVYRTTDGGKTWSKVLYAGPSSGASDLAWNPDRPNVVFAGMWPYRRTPWSSTSGGADGGLYRSADGGATWTKLSGNGLPAGDTGRIGLAVSRSNANRIYALIESKSGLLWASDDAGVTWRYVSSNTMMNERPFYYSRLAVDPSDPDHLFASSVQLAESRDGGKTWHPSGRRLHGDHHAMWWSRDGKRIIEGNDGGIGFSVDDGKTWIRSANIPIAQFYHVGFDRSVPYHMCGGLQDNGSWCTDDEGTWHFLTGGDGTWAWPDTIDPQRVFTGSAGGNNGGDLWMRNLPTREDVNAAADLSDQNGIPPELLPYRFNWEAPLMPDPFDTRAIYYGANVVFRSYDRGAHWTPISPDLTRDIKAHQQVSGGLTLDVTGAETSDTLLAIAPSPIRRGEIWTGSDDGVVELTLDGGAHWRNVTMPGLDPYSRVESIDASVFAAGTAFANVDRHFAGDRRPYVYETTDYGAHWRAISGDLPSDQFVRVVRQDTREQRLLFAGLEQSLWVSFDGGDHWKQLRAGLPPVSVRDLRIQTDSRDLLVVTHGRGAYVLDDLTPLEQLTRARAAGTTLFPVSTAYLFQRERGAIVTFFARDPLGAKIEILDSKGRVLDTLVPDGQGPLVRAVWNLAEAPPTPWKSAAEWNQGEDAGADAVPGTYTARLLVQGQTYTTRFTVTGSPVYRHTQSDYEAHTALQHRVFAMYDRIDRELNALDAARAALGAHPETHGDLLAQANALAALLSSNPQNDQDDDFLPDMLRERVQSLVQTFQGSYGRPTEAQYRQTAVLEARERQLAASFDRWQSAYAALRLKERQRR